MSYLGKDVNSDPTVGSAALSAKANLNTTNTFSNRQSIYKINTITVGGSSLSDQLEISNGGSGSAIITFHRNGQYAINMGLDTDNVWRLGGWSNGTNIYRLQSDTGGNLTVQGEVNTPQVTLAGTYPVLNMRDSDATAGNKNARLAWNAGSLYFERINDALNAVTSTPLQIDTSGNTTFTGAITSISFGLNAVSAAPANGIYAPAGNEVAITTAVIDRLHFNSSGLGTFRNSPGFGYGTGSGGAVTQTTSKGTAVTINKPSGQITTHNAALAAGAVISFDVNNSTVTATDTVFTSFNGNLAAVNSNYSVSVAVAAGKIFIALRNQSGVSLSEAVTINFCVIKGSAS